MLRDAKKAAKLPDPIREAAGLPVGPQGCYFVGGAGAYGQGRDVSILDYNEPARGSSTPMERLADTKKGLLVAENWGQPSLWCQWVPSEEGDAIVGPGSEKFYEYVPWLKYLIENFLEPWGYTLNGTVDYQGEEESDRGQIVVINNTVVTVEAE